MFARARPNDHRNNVRCAPRFFFNNSLFWYQHPGHSAGDVRGFTYEMTNTYQVC
jgi:hypothetical protein